MPTINSTFGEFKKDEIKAIDEKNAHYARILAQTNSVHWELINEPKPEIKIHDKMERDTKKIKIKGEEKNDGSKR
jgi:uncharacterized protein YdcH (DUF465 family)